ncbi:MAG: hypothetical protein AAF658_15655 [Myxococcota bacterium]
MYGDRLDGFVFGRIVKGTLGAMPPRASLDVSTLALHAQLPIDRVRGACRRLREGGLISAEGETLRITPIGHSMVRQGLREVRDEATGRGGPVS